MDAIRAEAFPATSLCAMCRAGGPLASVLFKPGALHGVAGLKSGSSAAICARCEDVVVAAGRATVTRPRAA